MNSHGFPGADPVLVVLFSWPNNSALLIWDVNGSSALSSRDKENLHISCVVFHVLFWFLRSHFVLLMGRKILVLAYFFQKGDSPGRVLVA